MPLNANILLQGQQADVVGALSRGAEAGQQVNDFRQMNALRDVYRENGAGIMRGEEQALNALAQFSPQEALGVQGARQGLEAGALNMQATQQQMAILSSQEQRAIQEQAAQMSREEREAEAARIEQGVAQALQAQTPEQWDAVVGQYDPALLGQFENREMIAGRYMSVADSLKRVDDISGTGGGGQVRASQILADGTTVQSTDSGVKVYSPTGDLVTGQSAADAIQAARAFEVQNQQDINFGRTAGGLLADTELGGQAAGAERLGVLSMEAGVAAYDDISKVNGSLSNINEAISAIDSGASSGFVANYFPNITEASASLNNAMNRMGLDVISSVTFGALSEAEMTLAMETAVPRNLEPQELKSWLIKKQEAQEKARDALTTAARYLTQPGNTINSWLAEQGQSGGGDTPTRLRFNPETGDFE